jgi:hypothetical protein
LIEVPTKEGSFGIVHVVRDADIRDVGEISAELRSVKREPIGTRTGRLLDSAAPMLGRLPGVYRLMYALMSRSRAVNSAVDTVQVTAVGMFAAGGGYAIAPPTLSSSLVVVGGATKPPRAVGDEVVVREVLDLTVTIDHIVVDGAPATRFGATLRRILEAAAPLQPTSAPAS